MKDFVDAKTLSIMEKSTFSSFFYVAPSKIRKNGTAPINMTITLNGERASFATHKFVKPEEWDANRQRVKGNNDKARLINEYLDKVRESLYRKELELLENGYILTAEVLRDAYLGKVGKLQKKTLFSVYEEFLSDLKPAIGATISDDTYYNYERAFVLLKEFVDKRYSRKDYQLHELNYNFMANFDTFLRTEHKHRQNTAVKVLKCLKHVVNIAVTNGYLATDPFRTYKTEREIVEKPFLTQEELEIIINKQFKLARLERVRDIFIFCCYTGLSYGDVKTLDESHFSTDESGRIWIKKRRVKTGVLFRVPLLPIPKMILEKYKGGEKLLPVIDLGSTDAYLKEIADLCGIEKNISFHTARFTFATTITIANHVSLEVAAKMMGHTNTRMTSHYAKIIDNLIAEEFDALEARLSKEQ